MVQGFFVKHYRNLLDPPFHNACSQKLRGAIGRPLAWSLPRRAVMEVFTFIFKACWLYYNIIKACLEYAAGCDDLHEEMRALFFRLWWSNSMFMAVRKLAVFGGEPHILWYPQPNDLHLRRQPVQGLCFYVAVELRHQALRWTYPRGLASSSPPHITLKYFHRFQDYDQMHDFVQKARGMLACEMVAGTEAWLFLDRNRMQHNVGRSCYAYTLLRRLQDLLFQPGQDRNPSTFHISTWIWAQQRDRVRRPRAIAMARP